MVEVQKMPLSANFSNHIFVDFPIILGYFFFNLLVLSLILLRVINVFIFFNIGNKRFYSFIGSKFFRFIFIYIIINNAF